MIDYNVEDGTHVIDWPVTLRSAASGTVGMKFFAEDFLPGRGRRNLAAHDVIIFNDFVSTRKQTRNSLLSWTETHVLIRNNLSCRKRVLGDRRPVLAGKINLYCCCNAINLLLPFGFHQFKLDPLSVVIRML